MSQGSEAYHRAEREMAIPPVSERGRRNENPKGIGFWALVAEDFRTHDRQIFEQGFWALFVHRFGNWRMGQPKIIRAPATLIYRILFKLIEWMTGISLWYTVKIGRRVRFWHHSGMIIGARAIGDDVHLRQNTTIGVGQTWRNDELPIIASGVDIGAGACIAGAVYVGANAKIGANALVLTDVPAGATVMGNPAQIYAMARPAAAPAAEPAPSAPPMPAAAPEARAPEPSAAPQEAMLAETRDLGTIALLGSANLDYLAMTFTEQAQAYGLAIAPHVPPFGQARTELLQEGSDLLGAGGDGPMATLIAERAEDLLQDVFAAPLSLAEADRDAYLDGALQPLLDLIRSARARLSGPVFVLGLAAFGRSTLGLADAASPRGQTALLARANALLAQEVAQHPDTYLLDAADMIAEVGRKEADPGTFWHLGRVPFGTAFGACLARRVLGGLLSLRGQSARILILDLDNTLWGGVLGEDGMEGLEIGGAYPGSAYRAFQQALKALTQRGIALAVASKNDEDLALRMISEHPEMALRLDDIVAHRIGWTEKAIGIQEMLDEIGLGSANAMFIDDNPVEREKVRKNIPGIIVPAFPDKPEDLAGWLLANPFLECLELTESDLKRTRQYSVRAKITAAKREFQNIEDFYRDLDMHLTFERYGATNQKRVLQLFAKTNQFNATLRRHDAAALARIEAEGGEVHAIGVSDSHSPYELMGVIVLRPGTTMAAAYSQDAAVTSHARDGEWWVDSLLLSCRILGRTVEQAIVAWAAGQVAAKGATALVGQVIEAPRNTPVRDVFSKSGLARIDSPIEQGKGGLYRQDLAAGVPEVPGYFTVHEEAGGDRPTAPDQVAKPTSEPAQTAVAPPPPVNGAVLSPELETRLAAVFRRTFGLDPQADLSVASMDTVERWDSLGHLKLAMEIEQALNVKIAGQRLGEISTFKDLKAAVAGQGG
ncbi:HAD-IIIC family phosphatase [Seohaeicola nanhaiensis]|uniref:HAD-IIIC family phosphatase n=1 Tax=Seohaeicola nanhaiensis TaxID=1387282 RepID=A0ABV9KLS0_9RHOB